MTLTRDEQKLILKVAKGLVEIAALAMPESFLASDRRVKAAKQLILAARKADVLPLLADQEKEVAKLLKELHRINRRRPPEGFRY
ncbi:MAG: hypothetical protein WC986_14695 [Elusimicrobiota bacterium]|jgi:hypothetical protein